jgi:hypothetical protein
MRQSLRSPIWIVTRKPFEVEKGLLVRTASLDDVIRMKEAADRMKDHEALPELRRLRGDPHPEFPRGFDPFKDFPIGADEGDRDHL